MAKKKSIETIENINIIDSAPCENENKYRDTIDALEDIYIDVVGVSNEYTTFLEDNKKTYKYRDTYLKSVILWLLRRVVNIPLLLRESSLLSRDARELAIQIIIDYLDLQIHLNTYNLDWTHLSVRKKYKIKKSVKKILSYIKNHKISDISYANELDLITAYHNKLANRQQKVREAQNEANNEVKANILKKITLDLSKKLESPKLVKKNKKVVRVDFKKLLISSSIIIVLLITIVGCSIWAHNDAIREEMEVYAKNELGEDYLFLSAYDRDDYWFETVGKVDYQGRIGIIICNNSYNHITITRSDDIYIRYYVNYKAIDGYNELGNKLLFVKFNGIKKIV